MEWLLKTLQDPAHIGILAIILAAAVFFYKFMWPKIQARINNKQSVSKCDTLMKDLKDLLMAREEKFMSKDNHTEICREITRESTEKIDGLFSHHREWVQNRLDLIQATINNDVLKALSDMKQQAIDNLSDLTKEIRNRIK